MELTGNAGLDLFPGYVQDMGVIVVTLYGVNGHPGALLSSGVFRVDHQGQSFGGEHWSSVGVSIDPFFVSSAFFM